MTYSNKNGSNLHYDDDYNNDHYWIEAQWTNTQPLAFRDYENYERFTAYFNLSLGEIVAYNEVEEISYFSSIVKMVREQEVTEQEVTEHEKGEARLRFYLDGEEFKFESDNETYNSEDSLSFHPIVRKTKKPIIKDEETTKISSQKRLTRKERRNRNQTLNNI